MDKDIFRMDKSSFSVSSLQESDNDVEYWLSKTPEERILAVEFLRQLIYGYDPATERLQRFFETAEFKTN
jgi:hypothetical protein